MKIAERALKIDPFHVMEVAKAASLMESGLTAGDPSMIHLTIGEPDFTAPERVQRAATEAIRKGVTQYTPALGIMPLREKISGWYSQRFGLNVPSERIVVTAGASAALLLTCLALIDEGDEILMPDPSYPCNRHFVSAAGGRSVLLPTTPQNRFQLTASQVAASWSEKTRGVLLASPSNPTGTSVHPDELKRIHAAVKARNGITILDELYLGLSFQQEFSVSGLKIDNSIISINSFSKYFSMTGWRLGWMVVPEVLVPVIERLAQNFFLCPSTVAQHAAIACFEPDSIDEYEQRRAEFKARRDWFIPALQEAGFHVPVLPDGAFYAWADCTDWCERWGVPTSWEFAFEAMKRAHVAISPGRDFGFDSTDRYVRFSTASSLGELEQAITRFIDLKRS
ncbi:pyridoxal phosphate-dependent aminotransferase [Pectobacterium aroidearum]|uniref:pyridoxal phosphate-dependent aminotransferase n=1 Tax=Pectobacterium aroidearum TaxID=1201031 RepID=UPI0032ED5E2A